MKRKTVLLAGCGGISKAWLEAAAQFSDMEITGLADLNLQAAEARKTEFNLASAVTGASFEQLLEQLHPDIVFDCTIPEAHYKVTMAALQHGCHILGEKPMAPTMEEARKMCAAALKSGTSYAVIQNRRYLDRIAAYREVIGSGKLGVLTTLNADFYLAPHFGGFREQMKHVLLLDMAIHTFDQARFLSGADPVSVFCHEFNPAGSWYSHGASAMAIFTMSDGSVFNYRGSWCAPGLQTSWQCTWRACCTEGSALWDGEEQITAERVCGDEGFVHPVETVEIPELQLPFRGHAGVIREFLDCLKNGKAPQTVCTDNLKSLAMVHAAIASAEEKRIVNIKGL